jgi:hypothetical protein
MRRQQETDHDHLRIYQTKADCAESIGGRRVDRNSRGYMNVSDIALRLFVGNRIAISGLCAFGRTRMVGRRLRHGLSGMEHLRVHLHPGYRRGLAVNLGLGGARNHKLDAESRRDRQAIQLNVFDGDTCASWLEQRGLPLRTPETIHSPTG